MQSEEPDGVHGNCFIKHLVTACHVHTCGMSLHISIGKNGKYTVISERNIHSLGTVSGCVNIGEGGFHSLVNDNSAIDLAAKLSYKSCIGAYSDRHDKNIKFDSSTAFHRGFISVKLCGCIAKHKFDTVFFKTCLH